ncbi:ABC transporter substrate-binding protein [Oxalobacteraceae bacterium CAVE-383]|nr:ABC transporter substrate-binding protein [Oxalobacteraceae bacterium CAVE-383]
MKFHRGIGGIGISIGGIRQFLTSSLALPFIALAFGLACPVHAAEPAKVRVIAFEGGFNLPVWVAQRQGFFAGNGVDVALSFTPNSVFLINSLFESKADIALASFDNVVAYQEGQGEADSEKRSAPPDLFAFMGGDNGFLSLVAAPGLRTFADLRGKTASVDAMTTGFAFALRQMAADNGLSDSDLHYVKAGATGNRYRDLIAGKQDVTLLRTPFEILATDKGYETITTGTKAFGAYMGSVGVTRRAWAKDNRASLIGFTRGYQQAIRWLYMPENRAVAEQLLVENVEGLTPYMAKKTCDLLLAPQGGLIRDLGFDIPGIQTVLKLRSKYAQPAKVLTDPYKYIDTTYLSAAAGR